MLVSAFGPSSSRCILTFAWNRRFGHGYYVIVRRYAKLCKFDYDLEWKLKGPLYVSQYLAQHLNWYLMALTGEVRVGAQAARPFSGNSKSVDIFRKGTVISLLCFGNVFTINLRRIEGPLMKTLMPVSSGLSTLRILWPSGNYVETWPPATHTSITQRLHHPASPSPTTQRSITLRLHHRLSVLTHWLTSRHSRCPVDT